MKKIDWLIISIILLIYGVVSFIGLGSTTNPESYAHFKSKDEYAIIKIEQGKTDVSKIRFYSGNAMYNLELYYSYDNISYTSELAVVEWDAPFEWKDYNITGDFTYLKIGIQKENKYLGEIGLFDTSGNLLEIEAVNELATKLVDEQNEVIVGDITMQKTRYFDEVYFPRTAYELNNNLELYEWVHPPLGKQIIAVFMKVFGNNPFAFRLPGNIAGILIIFVMYVLAKTLFKKTRYAVLAALVMALDGMHFVQTRIGTMDSFLVLFIMASYLFMLKYVLLSKLKSERKIRIR
jgi:hypothetical protein